MIKYTISIAVYNLLEVTKVCVASLLKSFNTYHSQDNIEILFIDNGSDQQTKDYFQELVEHIEKISSVNESSGYGKVIVNVLTKETNVGFIEAQNESLFFAQGQYFVVLNNDIEILDMEWLKKMENEFKKDRDVRLVGNEGTCRGLDEKGFGRSVVDNMDTEYIEGSCLMIQTNFAKHIGLFDSNLYKFAYCEDAHLSLTVREKGYKIKAIPIKMNHYRYSTGSIVEREIDLVGYNKLNHNSLQRRWKHYLQNRNFEYIFTINRKAGLGDVLLITPIINRLKEIYPFAKIKISSFPQMEEILRHNPNIDEFYTDGSFHEDIKEKKFDLDMCYENEPKLHMVDAYAKKLGIEVTDKIPRIYLTEEEKSKYKRVDKKPLCIIHTQCDQDWIGRTLPEPLWGQVSKMIEEDLGYEVMCIDEKYLREQKLSIRDLASLIYSSSLFVGIDSFPFHIAQAFHIPSVVFFGLIDPKYRVCEPLLVEPVRNEFLKCLGCHHLLESPRTVTKECLRVGHRVMFPSCTYVEVEQFKTAIKEVVKRMGYISETQKIRPKVIEFLNKDDMLGRWKGLDIGCGNDKLIKGKDIAFLGIDKRPLPGVDLIVDVSKILPFQNDDFDYVFSSHCLEDILDTESTLREWTRILKPGGYLILYLPHKELYKGVNSDHVHGQGFLPEEIENVLKNIGMKIIVSEIDEGEDRYSIYIVSQK